MNKLTNDQIAEIQLAVKEKRLAIDRQDDGLRLSNTFCDACGKDAPKYVLSICVTPEDVINDPMSGEIIFLGSSCYEKLKTTLGLK